MDSAQIAWLYSGSPLVKQLSCDDKHWLRILDLEKQSLFSLKQLFNLNLKHFRFLPLLIRPIDLSTQALQLGIFNNFSIYFLF